MRFLEFITRYIKRQPPSWLIVQASVLLITIGLVDYFTGYEVPVYPFYAVPILMVVWRCEGRLAAAAITLLSSFVWWWADVATGHTYPSEWLRVWDVLSRLIFFYLVMFAGSAAKDQRDAIRARMELLERSQKLEHEIVSISERERQSIGRDLHDGVCQYLAAIGFTADLLRQDLARQGNAKVQTAAEIARLLQDAIERVREVARGLSPVERDEGGLELALDELTLNTSQLTGKNCTFLCHEPVVIADNILAVHLFRIAQEAISNATRHGQARNIIIVLESGGGELSLRVSDDGVGFDLHRARKAPGLGLNIMRYRARVIGATLEIYPNTPTGTVVACTFVQRQAGVRDKPRGDFAEATTPKADGESAGEELPVAFGALSVDPLAVASTKF